VAVEGKHIRVHYKVNGASQKLVCVWSLTWVFLQGESADNDEWLPLNSKELRARIVAVEPPAPKSATI
jgi:hypothetical protein